MNACGLFVESVETEMGGDTAKGKVIQNDPLFTGFSTFCSVYAGGPVSSITAPSRRSSRSLRLVFHKIVCLNNNYKSS
jgi:hypothetical protein